jgi:hypothetical protein
MEFKPNFQYADRGLMENGQWYVLLGDKINEDRSQLLDV